MLSLIVHCYMCKNGLSFIAGAAEASIKIIKSQKNRLQFKN